MMDVTIVNFNVQNNAQFVINIQPCLVQMYVVIKSLVDQKNVMMVILYNLMVVINASLNAKSNALNVCTDNAINVRHMVGLLILHQKLVLKIVVI